MQIEVCNPKLRTTELVPYIIYRVNSWSSSAECATLPDLAPTSVAHFAQPPAPHLLDF